MKAAVVYASRTGTAARCAKRLAERLEADLLEITGNSRRKSAWDFPDVTAYDAVILGGGIRMGRLPRELCRWTSHWESVLLQKQVGLFLCCCFENQAADYFRHNFSVPLREHACCSGCLGGELDPSSLRGTDRLVAGLVLDSRGYASLPRLDLHRVDAYAHRFLLLQP